MSLLPGAQLAALFLVVDELRCRRHGRVCWAVKPALSYKGWDDGMGRNHLEKRAVCVGDGRRRARFWGEEAYHPLACVAKRTWRHGALHGDPSRARRCLQAPRRRSSPAPPGRGWTSVSPVSPASSCVSCFKFKISGLRVGNL